MKRIHTESRKGRRGHKWFPQRDRAQAYTGDMFGAIAAIIAGAAAAAARRRR